MEFPPILILAIIWLLIAPILSAAKKQQAKNAKSGAAKQSGARAPKKQPETGNSTHVTPEPARPTVMQPSITFTEHDDSVYQGSMNAITGEGFDPCHDYMLDDPVLPVCEDLDRSVPAESAPAALPLSFTKDSMVNAVVMSEILNRRTGTRHR